MKKIKYISITGPLVFDLGDSSVVNDIEKVTISNVVFPYQRRSIYWLRFLSNDKLIFACDGNLSGYHFTMNYQDITNQLNTGNPAFNGGDVEITTQYFKYNGNTLCTFDKVFGNTSSHFFLFAMNGNADDYMLSGSCGTIRIYAGGEVVAEYIPVLDDNNVPCMYDNIQHTYIYKSGSGTVTPGPPLFEPSKSVFNFSSIGGSESFNIIAYTGWTATTASDWVSLNQYSGTTGGTISVTCNRNYTETARTATITFTNANSETFNITVNQRKGTTEKEVNKMYRNGGVIFQRQMFSTRLSVSENSLSFLQTGATQNVTVWSNAPYTVSASTDWITISSASTGIAVTVPNYTGTTDRTGTITVTANNAGDIVTKTISVIQKVKTVVVDLNNEWVVGEYNPDSTLYDQYQSNSNYHIGDGKASIKITFEGYDNFILYINSFAESNHDYTIAWDMDKNIDTTTKSDTSGFQYNPGISVETNYRKVEYPNDGEEHFVWVTYRKDGSLNQNYDRGFILIPKE